jgi:hypothetical protein
MCRAEEFYYHSPYGCIIRKPPDSRERIAGGRHQPTPVCFSLFLVQASLAPE